MRKAIIHVNQHVIRANTKYGTRNPVITVKQGRKNTYTHRVDILDASGNTIASVLYQPDDPLECGARVWIEAYAGVRIHGDDTGVVSDSAVKQRRRKAADLPCPTG
jgi:hypothetical protein